MTTRVEPEELETTRSEKLLAVLLAVFILIGGVWAYFKLDEVAEPAPAFRGQLERALEPEQRELLREERRARSERFAARRTVRRERRDLVTAREEYRTALDAGLDAPGLREAYRQARREHDAAEDRLQAANDQLAAAGAAASPVHDELRELSRERAEEFADDRDRHDLIVLALRLALLVATVGGSYALISWLRTTRSRYLPVGLAWAGATGALALVMAVDYTTDAIDVTDVGPLALSLAGSALTMVAMVALQRYIARRVPARRTRRGECPFCGFPLRGGAHCEGCGRTVFAPCAVCREPRRVGAPHCASCGEA